MEETLTCNRSPFSQVFGRQGQLMQARFKLTLCYHPSKFFFINTTLNWHDASTYCKQHHDSLATIKTTVDNNKLATFPAGGWIGLADLPEFWNRTLENSGNSWRWSINDTVNKGGYQNWTLNQPDNVNASEHCGVMWNGQWDDVFCDDALPFVCFNGSIDPGLKNYTFVSTTMKWGQARSHCKQHYTELAMIMDEDENTAVASVIPPSTAVGVWIGLFRYPWRWSGPKSGFTNWAPGQPDNNNGVEHCAIMDADSLWRDENCEAARPFYCHHAFKTKERHIRLSLQTGANLSDPVIYNQIIQQVGAKFKRKGLTDFKLIWKPQKV